MTLMLVEKCGVGVMEATTNVAITILMTLINCTNSGDSSSKSHDSRNRDRI